MEIRQKLMMGQGKTPFDEIPITVLDLHVRAYNNCLHKGITTVRTAVNIVKQDDDSPMKSSLGRYFLDLKDALQKGGYLNGTSLDYYHLIPFSNRLMWLAKTQDTNGHWCHSIDHTIGAALSFIRAGHTSSQGSYASTVDRAVKWLERAFSGWRLPSQEIQQQSLTFLSRSVPLHNSTIAYALLCVLAENYDMPRPIAPFECPLTWDFKTVLEARRWALLVGNAPLYGWSKGGWDTFYDDEEGMSSNHGIEFAWMTVGAPRPIIGL
jgi:hypothetical protein